MQMMRILVVVPANRRCFLDARCLQLRSTTFSPNSASVSPGLLYRRRRQSITDAISSDMEHSAPVCYINITIADLCRGKNYSALFGVFTLSAITRPKMNRFGWNLERSEYIVRGWPWQILGAICAVATVWEAAEIFFGLVNNARSRRFSVGNIARNLNRTTWIGAVFSKKQKYSTNFKVLRL